MPAGTYVLDVGTGTGIWALEFAEQNPDAKVIGCDLSAIQPGRATAPNCSFTKLDVQDEDWLIGPNPMTDPILFDFVHARFLFSCFDSYLKVMRNAYNHMKPGAYIELVDALIVTNSPDGSHVGTTWSRVLSLIVQGGAIAGRDFLVPTRYKDLLAEAGFVDIVEKHWQVPFGMWPSDPKLREVGRFMRADAMGMIRGGGKLLRMAGVDDELMRNLPDMVHRELWDSRRYKHYMPRLVMSRPADAAPHILG
jgi:SAM-dependent methyltransferase